jgi:hypothetical protein
VAVVDTVTITLIIVRLWMRMVSAGMLSKGWSTALVLNAKLLLLTKDQASKLLKTLKTLERVIKSSRLVVKLQL